MMETTTAAIDAERLFRPQALMRIAEAFERDESDDFISSEFLVSSEIFDSLPLRKPAPTKLGRLGQARARALPKEGFGYWTTPPESKQAFAARRSKLSNLSTLEKARELKRTLEVSDPDDFADINI